ncbi:MAG: hypothetical protein GC165_07430 [Armatimonadetes bacterium]|nr:hypothetical protein [Armatimonadota bacterium]
MSNGITPDRTTVVTLDAPDVFVKEPSIFIELAHDKIASMPSHNYFGANFLDVLSNVASNISFLPGKGWQIASQAQVGDRGVEYSSWGSAAIELASLYITIQARKTYRSNNDLPGVSTGTNQASTGRIRYQMEVAAGDSFDVGLDADEAAFPPPGINSVQPLRRRAVSANDLFPTDTIIYSLEAKGVDKMSAISRIYFTNVPGSTETDGTKRGTGQYALTLFGNGFALLHERLLDPATGTYSWTNRFKFDFFIEPFPFGIHHTFVIWSDAVYADGVYAGSKIIFQCLNTGANTDWANWQTKTEIDPTNNARFPTYWVPNAGAYEAMPEKFRLDERIDVRSLWFVERPMYYSSAFLITHVVDVGYPISSTNSLVVEWFGDKPEGTDVTITCYDAETNTELNPTFPQTNYSSYGYRTFDPTNGRVADTSSKKYTRRKYYAIIYLTSSDNLKTPTISRVRFYRAPVLSQTTTTPFELSTVNSISLTGQDSDPTHETGLIQCTDFKGELSTLDTRSGMAIKVEVKYDPADDTKVSSLFNGYVVQANRTIKGGTTGADWPVDNWSQYSITCTGEWQRLMQATASQRWDFTIDASTTSDSKRLPWKITDIIRILLGDSYLDENIIIPEPAYPVRLFGPSNDTQLLVVEMFTPIYPVIAKLAMLYLGGWLVWDGNASNATGTPYKMGAWRLLVPPRPVDGAWVNLAHFKSTPSLASSTGVRLRMGLPYQEVETGIGGQEIQTCWIQKGSYLSYVVPPEANAVWVSGTGVNASTVPLAIAFQELQQVAMQFKAAEFYPDQPITPDPTNPVYTNGRPVWIYYGDNELWSQEAVNFYTRRIFDLACQAQQRVKFTAPMLLITDKADTDAGYQRQPRPLRYGDPVLINGVQHIIANVNPDWTATRGGTRNMLANYEAFLPTDLDHWKTGGTIQ